VFAAVQMQAESLKLLLRVNSAIGNLFELLFSIRAFIVALLQLYTFSVKLGMKSLFLLIQ